MINIPTKPQNTARTAPGSLSELDLDKLDGLLANLESEHEQLLTLAGLQRDAIGRADTKDLGQVVEQTAQTLGRIAGIENTRQRLIKRPDGSVPTVQQIAAEADDQHAEALSNRSVSLRKLMLQVNQEHKAVREASQALSDHMNGLLKQVSAKLSHTGTYGRRGAVDPGRSLVVSSLDTTR